MFIYSLFISIGILGIGYFLWYSIKNEFPLHSRSNNNGFDEHPLLTLGISWFLGYFCYESVLILLAVLHYSTPFAVSLAGILLTLLGYYWLFNQRAHLIKKSKTPLMAPWEFVVLLGLSGFLLFWNLYPSFDVDSLAFYFANIKNWLTTGGKSFSPFTDIRYAVPMGENHLYALGFALQPSSTLFQQLIHGLSKIMLMCCVYGAVRSCGGGAFGLIAAALIVSEEHVLASGANMCVRINIPITASVLFMGYGLCVFIYHQRSAFLILSFLAGFIIISCKYLGISYFITLLTIYTGWLIFTHRWKEINYRILTRYPKTVIILLSAGAAAAIPYIYNWIITGTPVYPASIGPFTSSYYDSTVAALARDWHYHLSFPEALKNLSAFMVWPGILSSKILIPLMLVAGILSCIVHESPSKKFLTYSMIFFISSIIITLICETYMVFEMRYYRYGIGMYSLAATMMILFIFQTIVEHFKLLQKIRVALMILFILCVSMYCIKYSFSVMGTNRPTASQIINFLSAKESPAHIIDERLSKYKELFDQLQQSGASAQHLGFILSFSWPHTYFPIEGKNIAFMNTGGFPSIAYFNEGLFAQALLDNHINIIFNQLANADYPMKGSAVWHVLTTCRTNTTTTNHTIISLSDTCLEELAKTKDINDGKQRLAAALEELSKLPPYEPFNIPSYGGSSGLIK